ncbi:MAG: hypothetical protein WC570_03930 [Patescibacteria group bacterium]
MGEYNNSPIFLPKIIAIYLKKTSKYGINSASFCISEIEYIPGFNILNLIMCSILYLLIGRIFNRLQIKKERSGFHAKTTFYCIHSINILLSSEGGGGRQLAGYNIP